jgi:tRNA G10  N-methylase Trm11
MSDAGLIKHLRLVASYHMGTDLTDRIGHAERVQLQQRRHWRRPQTGSSSLRPRVARLLANCKRVAESV